MKALMTALPFFPRISRYSAMDDQGVRERLRLRMFIVLALMFLAFVFLLCSSGNSAEDQELTSGTLNSAEATSETSDDGPWSKALLVAQGADIPFRDRDGVTLYVPYGTSEATFSLGGTRLAFHSSRTTGGTQGEPGRDNDSGSEYPNSNGYGGSGDIWMLSQPPSWSGNPETLQSPVDFAEVAGPWNGDDAASDGTGKDVGTHTDNNPSQDINGSGKGDLPIVKENVPPQPVPEPSSLLVFAASLLSLLFCSRSASKKAS